jgi:hypothetical protein
MLLRSLLGNPKLVSGLSTLNQMERCSLVLVDRTLLSYRNKVLYKRKLSKVITKVFRIFMKFGDAQHTQLNRFLLHLAVTRLSVFGKKMK